MALGIEVDPLTRNLAGDRQGLPDWYTHFGSEAFAQSAVPIVESALQVHYIQGSIDIVGLGAGTAYYERVVGRALSRLGWNPSLTVSDLQEGVLRNIPEEPFPVHRVMSDSTKLPLPDRLGVRGRPVVILSRAVEHYLSDQGKRDLIREAARILRPGELYLPQLSSGRPTALRAFEAVLRAIAGKEEKFLLEDDYRRVLTETADSNGGALFEVLDVQYAEPQPRNTTALARRYLNSRFLSNHRNRLNGQEAIYEAEVDGVVKQRELLGGRFLRGEIERDEALRGLDRYIEDTSVFHFYSQVFEAAARSANGKVLEGGDGLSFGNDGKVTISLTYPVFTLRRTEHPLHLSPLMPRG